MMGPVQRESDDSATPAACLERLATALCGYPDLEARVRAEGPAPWLAVRNITVPLMSETVTVTACRDGLAYMWSWGKPIGNASVPDRAAEAIAYVLAAAGTQPGPVNT